MSGAAVEGPGGPAAQLEAALAANSGAEGAYDHDSEDDFQYEEVEVPRYVASLPAHTAGALLAIPTPNTQLLTTCSEEEEDDDISEDLDEAMRSLQALTSKVSMAKSSWLTDWRLRLQRGILHTPLTEQYERQGCKQSSWCCSTLICHLHHGSCTLFCLFAGSDRQQLCRRNSSKASHPARPGSAATRGHR